MIAALIALHCATTHAIFATKLRAATRSTNAVFYDALRVETDIDWFQISMRRNGRADNG
ncbi:hypothetical protein [Rhodopseudomonas sp.]|uniref:hypothetical protein n=1 Tax=Rhodopseudomonas sp. TaxID=1078 RepID=UPI0025EC76A9|nr:hypothetical protein [Rhodopseudomonas sp.]